MIRHVLNELGILLGQIIVVHWLSQRMSRLNNCLNTCNSTHQRSGSFTYTSNDSVLQVSNTEFTMSPSIWLANWWYERVPTREHDILDCPSSQTCEKPSTYYIVSFVSLLTKYFTAALSQFVLCHITDTGPTFTHCTFLYSSSSNDILSHYQAKLPNHNKTLEPWSSISMCWSSWSSKSPESNVD
jgi:hypothetical protein